jgi:hypothetical protein
MERRCWWSGYDKAIEGGEKAVPSRYGSPRAEQFIAFLSHLSRHAGMITLGFSTLADVLSWIVVVALGSKVLATLIVLTVDKNMRDRRGWGAALWWVTKIAPLIAIPCMIWLAVLRNDAGATIVFAFLGLFVLVAVPLKARKRKARIARQAGG